MALTSGKLDDGKEVGYGFGWVVEKRFGRRFVWHDGGWVGTSTIIGRWPDDRVTIVLLSNNDQFDRDKTLNSIAKTIFSARKNQSATEK